MKQNPTPRIMNLFMLTIRNMWSIKWYIWKWRYSCRCPGGCSKRPKSIVYFIVNRYQVHRMKEQVHEIDLGAYFIMSEVADIFSNNMDKV